MQTPLQELKSAFFRTLAHPTRIRLLEQLTGGERSVSELQAALGLEQPVVSQHLAALRAGQIVTVRRTGVQAYYALSSPLVGDVLTVSRAFLTHRLGKQGSMLRELRREGRRA
jgi:DNA-binding transcriptional ArsR family regulator